jgi:hypothetical protein
MTVSTLWNVAVCIGMTEVTSKGCMLAGTSNHFFIGASMTRNTNFLMFAIEVDIKRLMRIVATEAIFDFVVGATVMAVITIGNVVFYTRTMPFVTRLAIDFRLMGCSACSDLCRLLVMTFGTIINTQHRLLSQCDRTQTCNERQSKSCNQQPLHLTLQHLLSSSIKNPIYSYTYNKTYIKK